MRDKHLQTIQKSLRFTSRVLFLKGIVAGSVTALAVFGIVVPYLSPFFGIAPNHSAVAGGVVATVGGLAGALLAAKA